MIRKLCAAPPDRDPARATAAVVAIACLTLQGCPAPAPGVSAPDTDTPLAELVDFPVGAAVPAGDARNSLLRSAERQAIVARHFDSITAENIMKMAYLHPAPNTYDFEDADLLVAWARERGIQVHGHTLVWHKQAPEWMTAIEAAPGDYATLLDDHVRSVAGHFAGRLTSWDVVNEAFTDDEPSTYRDTIWYRNLGPDYIELAFRAARDADPQAVLYYNDYGISGANGTGKLDRILQMADDFKQRGVPLDGIGFQMHIDADRPDAAALRAAFARVVERGLRVRISELDISLNSSEKVSRLTTQLADIQKQKYEEVARVYRETVPAPLRGGITVWGLTDGDSWIPGFHNRADWPLLFNADFSAKPALHGLAAGLAPAAARVTFDWFAYSGDDALFDPPPPPGHYQNPVAAGFFPDPSILRQGDDYYMVHSSFAWLPGIPILHSRNLTDWRLIGHVLTRERQADFDGLGVSRGIFAPTLRYHDGLFYVITTAVDAGGNFYVTANNPGGPWSDPVWLPDIDGIDPDLFFGPDGRAWIAHNGPPPAAPRYDGHRAIWLWELDTRRAAVVPGSRRLLVDGGTDIRRQPIWIEGPHLFRKDDYYYLLCAEGGTGDGHAAVVFRARELTGPFEAWSGNPILTQRDLDPDRADPVAATGHADFVTTPGGDWWAVFLGARPYEAGLYNTGRETFLLPVRWADGWPAILPPGVAVPRQPVRPAGLGPAAPGHPLTGNFTRRDDFEAPVLGPEWNLLRRPDAPWLHLGDGMLQLEAGTETLAGAGQPSFVARRQQHASFRAVTALRLPSQPTVAAGLAAFQNETHHYFLGVERHADAVTVFVERAAGAAPVRVAERQLPGSNAGAILELEIAADRAMIGFRARVSGDEWTSVAEGLDARILSTSEAGGFVGTMLGPYVRQNTGGGTAR